jgi:hypothetical protein
MGAVVQVTYPDRNRSDDRRLVAWITLLTDKERPHLDLGREFVAGLEGAGCSAEHWRSPW